MGSGIGGRLWVDGMMEGLGPMRDTEDKWNNVGDSEMMRDVGTSQKSSVIGTPGGGERSRRSVGRALDSMW